MSSTTCSVVFVSAMTSKSRDIILLLGAGASVEAGVPSSPMMIGSIEKLLETQGWARFRQLYHQIKRAIHYAAGIKGRFNADVLYNIETLVNTLYELERNEDHPIYPFVAAWNSRLIAHAGSDVYKMHGSINWKRDETGSLICGNYSGSNR
jgi:hypothetical protein